jgi:hypothetical protein
MAGRERGRLIEEEQLGKQARGHERRPASATKFQAAGDPPLRRVQPADLPSVVVKTAAVAVDEPSLIGRDQLAQGRDAVLQWHTTRLAPRNESPGGPFRGYSSGAMAEGGDTSGLTEAAREGCECNRATPCPESLTDVRELGPTNRVDPLLIRFLLIGGKLADGKPPPGCETKKADPSTPDVDPHGIRICGAFIDGPLDLDGLPSDGKIGLELTGCRLSGELLLRAGGLPWLRLRRCILPAILADDAEFGSFEVDECAFEGPCRRERLSLVRAHVSGDLLLTKTIVSPPGDSHSPPTVQLRGVKVDGRLSLAGTTVSCTGAAERPALGGPAAVSLMEANVGGALTLRGGTLASDHGPALLADYLTVGGDLLADVTEEEDRFSARGGGGPAAVCLDGATITGRLALSGALLTGSHEAALSAQIATIKDGALLNHGFVARGAVRLRGSTVTGGLTFERAKVSVEDVSDASAEPADPRADAAVVLTGMTVTDRLVLRGAQLKSDRGAALEANLLTVTGDALMDRSGEQQFCASGAGELGAVCLTSGSISGQLVMSGAQLSHPGGTAPALLADLLTVKGATLLDDGFHADGAVRLWGATLTGHVSLQAATVASHATTASQEAGYAAALWLSTSNVSSDLLLHRAAITSEHGPAIMADYLTVGGDLLGDSEQEGWFAATGADPRGSICLDGATITGRLSLGGARLVNDRGPGLSAELATCKHGVYLDWGFEATGAVRLREASITGRLSVRDATISNSVGPSRQDPGDAAALWLANATIGTHLDLRGAHLRSLGGPALMADGVTVNGDARLGKSDQGCFTADGQGEFGAVCLARANVAGDLSMAGAVVSADTANDQDGCAVDARDAKIGGDAVLDREFVSSAPDGQWLVSLAGATVGKRLSCRLQLTYGAEPRPKPKSLDLSRATVGTFVIDVGWNPLEWRMNPNVEADDLINLDGLTYTTMPKSIGGNYAVLRATADETVRSQLQLGQWIRLLSWARFAPQPYQQLASAYEATGDDSSARALMEAQGDDTVTRGRLKTVSRGYQRLLKVMIGYGYRSSRAIRWLFALLLIAIGLGLLYSGPHYIKLPEAAPKTGFTDCTFPGNVNYGFNLAFPIVALAGTSATACDTVATTPWWVYVVGWIIRLLAATLAVFYAAGVSGLIRSAP